MLELKDLQQKELELLILFRDICDKNQLTYYISGGTYLGAIRHKGFIPWDDDIDVAMPRTDYDKFVEIASKEFIGSKQFWHYSSISESKRPNSRLVDLSVKIVNNSWKVPRQEPVWIDIFPLDGLPKSSVKANFHKMKLLFLKVMVGFANYENVQDNKKDRPLHEKMLLKVNSIFSIGKYLNLNHQYDILEDALRKYSDESSEVYFNFHGAYRFNSIFNKKNIYAEGIILEFEGNYFNAPKNYDDYLKQIYGDYMQLPPEHMRNKHNTEIIKE
ncbi:LicD family protein [Enterococcus sp. AZ177]|uniref:LicD family protein n=1 Tax=unclassified Enterococcus TaxID=2608891 RepID=UPI003D3003D8